MSKTDPTASLQCSQYDVLYNMKTISPSITYAMYIGNEPLLSRYIDIHKVHWLAWPHSTVMYKTLNRIKNQNLLLMAAMVQVVPHEPNEKMRVCAQMHESIELDWHKVTQHINVLEMKAHPSQFLEMLGTHCQGQQQSTSKDRGPRLQQPVQAGKKQWLTRFSTHP